MSSSRGPEPPLEILEGLRHPVPMEERPDADARRRASIDAIAAVIRDGRRNRLRSLARKIALGAAAAAVLMAVVAWLARGSAGVHERPVALVSPSANTGGAVHVIAGTLVTTRSGVSTVLGAGADARIPDGDEFTTATGSDTVLTLPRAVRVELFGDTTARIVAANETEQHLRVELGRVEVSVPKPGGPRVFAIQTPDSDVIVHGTEFSVLVKKDAESQSSTTVTVTRGSVLVVNSGEQRLLEPGMTWSSEAAPPPVTMPPKAAPAKEETSGATPTAERRIARAARTSPPLTEQNRLFQSFLDARDAGNDAVAVRYLDELLARFPDAPLADQARLARFRTLQRLGSVPSP